MTDLITLREPSAQEEAIFLSTMSKSQEFHFPFISAPKSPDEFNEYLKNSKKESEKYFIAYSEDSRSLDL
jgi:ribosomal-protein-alanine N-acetyltransferase